MKKALIIGLVGAVALVIVAKKTNVFSYASTFASQVSKETKDQIPAKFELERIRHEIANMDGDVSQMIRPIAEYKADIERLRRDITKGQTSVEEQKKNLLGVVEDLQGDPKFVVVNAKKWPADQVRSQLQRDLEGVKRIELDLKTKQKVLEAKETSLKATQEQLTKVVAKKRDYQVRLAQLEAEAEMLQGAKIGSDVKFDNSKASQIETALTELERRLERDRHEIELWNKHIVDIQLQERVRPPVDLSAIRSYLEGSDEQPAKTASNK